MSTQSIVLFTGQRTPLWGTPQALYEDLDAEFGFALDAASDGTNGLAKTWLTADDNALWRSWAPGPVFVNPPYGRKLGEWLDKARREQAAGVTVVMLLPVRSDTAWFHEHVLGKAEIRFIRKRIRYLGDSRTGHNAPFPSMIVVYRAYNDQ